MRIAFVNIFKPRDGSGDGITEYTYQLYKKLKGRHKIDLFYALDESKRVDIKGRLYVETLFKLTAKRILEGNYDIVHITNPEIGYFAKSLKRAQTKAKIVTTVHDFVRVSYLHGKTGGLQNIYDYLVTKNNEDAINNSDFIIFTSTTEMKYGKSHYKLPEYSWIPIGAKDVFLEEPIPKKKRKDHFTIGYIGGLIKSRHLDFTLKTAELLDQNYRFKIYGVGAELPALLKYKDEKNIDNVEFMGFAPEDEILRIYDSFDVFMSNSSVDVASLPIEDALARGLPVVSAKNNKYDDELRNRLYEAENPKDAASIISGLRRRYPKERQRKILAYAKKISWKNVAKRTAGIYSKLTKGIS